MAVTVRLSQVLTRFTGGQREVEIEAASLRDVVDKLGSTYPPIAERLCDAHGELRSTLNFFINNEDMRLLDGPETGLSDGDEVSIVPMMAGG